MELIKKREEELRAAEAKELQLIKDAEELARKEAEEKAQRKEALRKAKELERKYQLAQQK